MTDATVIAALLLWLAAGRAGRAGGAERARGGPAPPPPPGLFHPADSRILATADAVFATLNINDNFTKSDNVAYYMSMHHFVKDAVERNDKIYRNIFRNSKSSFGNKTGVLISNIDKVIEETIRKQKVKIRKDLFTHNKSDSRDASDNRIVVDFIKFAKSFNLNINTPLSYDLLDLTPGKPPGSGRAASGRRVFAGTATHVARFPFVGSVHVRGRFACAGALVREDLLITAASSLVPFISPNLDARSVKVRVGSDYTNKLGELAAAAALRLHPRFNRTSLRHNLAAVPLQRRLRLRKGKVAFVQFDRTPHQLLPDVDKILILGWGEKKPLSEPGYRYDGSDQLLSYGLMDVQDLERCRQIYTRMYVSNKHFCAGFIDKGSGACQFDVGGPALAGGTLMGVVSFGAPRCGQRDAPTVFTKLGFYAPWIDSFSKDASNNRQVSIKVQPANMSDFDEPGDEKLYYNKFVKTGLKVARDTERNDLFYDLEEDKDIFKKPTKADPHTHPLIDKAIFLDPALVPTMPRFSEERAEPTAPHDAPGARPPPPPLAADKELENLNWELVDGYVNKLMGAKTPTRHNQTTTTARIPLATTGSTYPNLSPFFVGTTAESAYGEYHVDMSRPARSSSRAPATPATPATRGTRAGAASAAGGAATAPGAQSTRIGKEYYNRSPEPAAKRKDDVITKLNMLPVTKRDQANKKKPMVIIFKGPRSSP